MNVFDLVATLSLDSSEYESELGKAKGGAEDSGSAISGAFTKVKNTLVGLGIAKVVKDMGVAVINTGREFDTAMSQVAATMGTSVSSIKDLEDVAREYGAKTQFSAAQAAEGLNYLALAGYSTEQQIAALPTVLNLASAGAMDLGAASDMVTDAMSALGIEVTQSNLETFADQLAKTASSSNTSVAQLGEAILTVGGTAKTMAGGTVEAATALGILADNGIKASEGGTHLRNILLAMNPTTDDAVAAWKKLGVTAYTSDGKMKPLKKTFGELAKAMKGMTDQEKQDILSDMFNKTDLAAIEAMLGTTADRWDELGEAIEGSWYTADGINETWKSLGMTLEHAEINLSKVGITTEEFTNALNKCDGDANTFLDILKQSADDGTELSEVLKLMGTDVESLQEAFDSTAGAAEYMSEVQQDNFEGSLKKMSSALDELKLAIWETFDDQAKSAVDTFTEKIGEAQTFVEEHEPEISAAVELIGTAASESFATVGTAFNEIKEIYQELTGWKVEEENEDGGILYWLYLFQVGAMTAFHFFRLAIDGISDKIAEIKAKFKEIKDNIFGWWEGVKEKFEKGREKVEEVFDAIGDKVEKTVDFVKGLMNFEWALPPLKIPKIKASWEDLIVFDKVIGSYPEFHLEWEDEEPAPINPVQPGLSWFAKAYDVGYMFDSPTVLGRYGFGDGVGAEMVIGKEKMMGMISEAQNSGMDRVVYMLERVVEIMAEFFPEFRKGGVISVDDVVDKTASAMRDRIREMNYIESW